MVDHEVDDQIEVVADTLHVFPGAEGRVHLVVGQRSEAPVGGGRVERQQVNAADGAAQVAAQHVVQLEQVLAQAVGIADQLDLVFQVHEAAFLAFSSSR